MRFFRSEVDAMYDSLLDSLLIYLKNIDARLTRIEHHLIIINYKENNIMTDLSSLETAVSQETSVVDSAISLIEGLAAEVQAAGVDPEKLGALVDTLNAKTAALANAVAQNTFAGPGGEPTPPADNPPADAPPAP